MGRLIFLIFILCLLSPAYVLGEDKQKEVPVFTDQDLEKYKSRTEKDAEHLNDIKQEASGILKVMDAEGILKENSGAVVAVAAYDEAGIPFSHGSGFIVRSDGAVVTSYHVIGNADSVKVKAGGRVLNVTGLIYVDKENDIAILKTEGRNLQEVKLGYVSERDIGERVYVISNPKAEENVISEGVLSNIRVPGYSRRVLQITAGFSMGSSGAPVFNNRGEVIGIASSILREAENTNFAVAVDAIKDRITDEVSPIKDATSGGYKESADYWIDLGNNLSYSGNYKDAVEAFKKALEIKNDSAGALNGLGIAYMNLKKFEEAEEAYRQALKYEPDSAWIRSNFGLLYLESKKYRKAAEELKEAVRIMPELAAAQYNLGIAYRGLRMYKEALETLKQAVKINPKRAEAQYALGLTYLNLEKKDAALEVYRMLKEIDPVLAEKLSKLINR